MTDPHSYYAVWVDPDRFESSWLPGYFNPIYEDLEKELESQPEFYRSLSEIVEVVSPTWHKGQIIEQSRLQVIHKGGELEIEEIGSKTPPSPLVVLPAEAIIIFRIFSQKLSLTYWRDDLFPGKGVATSNYIVLKPAGPFSIGWLLSELQKDYCVNQIERTVSGTAIAYHLNIKELLKIKIRILSQKEIERFNQVIVNNVRNKTAIGRAYQMVIEGQKAVKPFILTGATFQEKIDQFEENLLKQSAIDSNRIFYIEASTSNPNEDLFVVRQVGVRNKKDNFRVFLKPQNDPVIDAEWRKWYWEATSQNSFRIFNSIPINHFLPSYLLRRMISITPDEKATLLLKDSLLPTYRWFRNIIESHQYNNEINWNDVRDDITQKWTQLHIETKNLQCLQNVFSYYELILDADTTELSEKTEFPDLLINWFRFVFTPAFGLKVVRESETAGVYLLFGVGENHNPFEGHALLEGVGQRLCQILEQPSEVIYDAARRESLRRLSDIMHRLNGPTGRIVNALDDIEKYLYINAEIANSLVPDEETVNRRISMGRKKIDDYTLKARIDNISSNINQIRQVVYKLKRLNMIQGSDSRDKIDLANLFRDLTTTGFLLNHDLELSVLCPEEHIPVYIHKDSIFVAIEEVIKNADRELKERKISNPSILINISRIKDSAFIAISDNALPPEMELINRPFDEGASSYSRSGLGSGFGLYIVIEAFTKHGGTCRLFANKDENGDRLPGVTFEATLPIYRDEKEYIHD